MKNVIVIGSVALMLGGCATAEQRQAHAQAQIEGQRRYDDQQCQSYGAKVGSPAYIQCRGNQDFMRRQEAENDLARSAAAYQQLMQNSQPAPVIRVCAANDPWCR